MGNNGRGAHLDPQRLLDEVAAAEMPVRDVLAYMAEEAGVDVEVYEQEFWDLKVSSPEFCKLYCALVRKKENNKVLSIDDIDGMADWRQVLVHRHHVLKMTRGQAASGLVDKADLARRLNPLHGLYDEDLYGMWSAVGQEIADRAMEVLRESMEKAFDDEDYKTAGNLADRLAGKSDPVHYGKRVEFHGHMDHTHSHRMLIPRDQDEALKRLAESQSKHQLMIAGEIEQDCVDAEIIDA